jgi:hypothetical protein
MSIRSGVNALALPVGTTASGAPSSGTYAVGQYVVDKTGEIWICTVAGTPGTWKAAGSGTELAYAYGDAVDTTATSQVDVPGASITFTVGSRPVYVEASAPLVANDRAVTTSPKNLVAITDASNVEKGRNLTWSEAVSHGFPVFIRERIDVPGTYTRKMRVSNGSGTGNCTIYGTAVPRILIAATVR